MGAAEPWTLAWCIGCDGKMRLAILGCVVALLGSACASQAPTARSPKPPEASGLRVTAAGHMTTPRAAHSSTRLANGRVLIAGGCTDDGCNLGSPAGATAEIFDPATGKFRSTGSMLLSRDDHRAVLLPDGRVLVAGGWTAHGVTSSTELYDPRTAHFTPGPDMRSPRAGFAAVVLNDALVLLVGGETEAHVQTATAEIFDPRMNTFTFTGSMSAARMALAATVLEDGEVLVAGGIFGRTVLAAAELFDPRTGRFSAGGSMAVARYKAAAVTLADGRALVIGGAADVEGEQPYASTELFDPRSGSFTRGPTMSSGRYKLIDSTVRLGNGDVVVAGGAPRPEILSAAKGAFQTVEGTLGATRLFLTATALGPRSALLAGGYDRAIRPTAQAWLIG